MWTVKGTVKYITGICLCIGTKLVSAEMEEGVEHLNERTCDTSQQKIQKKRLSQTIKSITGGHVYCLYSFIYQSAHLTSSHLISSLTQQCP